MFAYLVDIMKKIALVLVALPLALLLAPVKVSATSGLPWYLQAYCVVRENGTPVKAGFLLSFDAMAPLITSDPEDLAILFSNKPASELPECKFINGKLDWDQIPRANTPGLQVPGTNPPSTTTPPASNPTAPKPGPQQNPSSTAGDNIKKPSNTNSTDKKVASATANGEVLDATTETQSDEKALTTKAPNDAASNEAAVTTLGQAPASKTWVVPTMLAVMFAAAVAGYFFRNRLIALYRAVRAKI